MNYLLGGVEIIRTFTGRFKMVCLGAVSSPWNTKSEYQRVQKF